MPGPIAEITIEEGATRMRIPAAIKSYLKLQGGEKVEFLSVNVNIEMEDFLDNCVILRVKRR